MCTGLLHFFRFPHISFGCNSSFITLISKVINPLLINDYRPIILVGVQYKVIAMTLSLHLTKVVDYVVSTEQLTFIKGWYILDGHLVVNEVVDWCRWRKKKVMVFKVDFEKTYGPLS